MIKLIDIDQASCNEQLVHLIKLSSRGLVGADRTLFAKRASVGLLDRFSDIQFAPGEVPIHLYAMGSTETVGPNRNGDGFKAASLRKFHDTFVKFARCYREHLNNDTKRSYGVVKASAFNEEMGRCELICALNGTKAAAAANKGLVADEELQALEKIASGQPYGVSMSCSVAHDVCSYCGNKAASRATYCEAPEFGGHCKGGGLRRHMGDILADGHHLHADNPEPRFFDISMVKKPADRIAYVTGCLSKAASTNLRVFEPEIDLGILPPVAVICGGHVVNARTLKAANWLSALAHWEHEGAPTVEAAAQTNGSLKVAAEAPPRGYHHADICRALADHQCVLPLAGFVQVFANQTPEEATKIAATIGPEVATCFSRLISNGAVESMLENNPFRANSAAPEPLRKWAASLEGIYSLAPECVRRRSIMHVIRGTTPQGWRGADLLKTASSQQLVQQYACYQVAALTDIFAQNADVPLTSKLVVVQNQTSSQA